MEWSTILLKVAMRFPEVLPHLIEKSAFSKHFLMPIGIQTSFNKNQFCFETPADHSPNHKGCIVPWGWSNRAVAINSTLHSHSPRIVEQTDA
jgi:hypothetical protein